MLLGSFGEREIEPFFVGERERDATVLRGVGAGEKAGVVAVLHILTISFENPRVGTGLRENLAQHGEIKTECGSEAEAFGESGGVDIHHHVHERLHLRGLASGTDVAERNGEILEDRLGALEGCVRASGHEIEGAFSGLSDARRHAGFEGLGSGFVGQSLDIEMHLRRNGGAVHEEFAFRTGEEAVAMIGKDRTHGFVIGDDRDDHAGEFGDAG